MFNMNVVVTIFSAMCVLQIFKGYSVAADDDTDTEKRAGMSMLRLGRSYRPARRGFSMLRLGKRDDVENGLRKLLYSIAENRNLDSRQAPLPRYGRELDWVNSGLPLMGDDGYAPLRPVPRLGRFRRSVEDERAIPMPRIGREQDKNEDGDDKIDDSRAIPMPRIGKDLSEYDGRVVFYDPSKLPEVERRGMSMLRLGKRRMAMLRLGKRMNGQVQTRAMAMLRLGRSNDKTKSS